MSGMAMFRQLRQLLQLEARKTFRFVDHPEGIDASLVVPVKEFVRDLPLAIHLEQGEYVGSSGIGAGQPA